MGNIKRGYMIKKLFNLCDISVQGIIIKQIICLIYMVIYTVLSIIFPSFIGKLLTVDRDTIRVSLNKCNGNAFGWDFYGDFSVFTKYWFL